MHKLTMNKYSCTQYNINIITTKSNVVYEQTLRANWFASHLQGYSMTSIQLINARLKVVQKILETEHDR